MTQSAPTPAASVHTRPAVASAIGAVIGVLTIAQGYFGSGHLPSGAEIASILGGAGLTLGSVAAFVGSHLGITKAQVAHDATLVAEEWAKAEPLLATVGHIPGIEEHVTALADGLDARIQAAVATAVPQPVAVDIDHLAEQAKAKVLAAFAGATVPAQTGGAVSVSPTAGQAS